ncbi:hypothetical protein [Helicobacter rodentium]|nr:hypothetical protein [Helicobacter rodentium]
MQDDRLLRLTPRKDREGDAMMRWEANGIPQGRNLCNDALLILQSRAKVR